MTFSLAPLTRIFSQADLASIGFVLARVLASWRVAMAASSRTDLSDKAASVTARAVGSGMRARAERDSRFSSGRVARAIASLRTETRSDGGTAAVEAESSA